MPQSKKAISIRTLKQKRFKLLDFDGLWKNRLGTPEEGFCAMIYGPSGSGKTTEMIRLAAYCSQFGKVMYNSWEEGISQTLQETIADSEIPEDVPMYFYDSLEYDVMCAKAKSTRSKFIVIDSIQYMAFSYAQYQDFVKRFPTKSLLLISQVNNSGKPRNGTQILHAVDIKMQVNAGAAEYRSRYRKGGHWTGHLWKDQPTPSSSQLSLLGK